MSAVGALPTGASGKAWLITHTWHLASLRATFSAAAGAAGEISGYTRLLAVHHGAAGILRHSLHADLADSLKARP